MSPATSIIRGYNQTFFFNFTIRNMSPTTDIVPVDGVGQNFNATLFFTGSRDLANFSDEHSLFISTYIPLAQQQDGITSNGSTSLSGDGEVLLPRSLCHQYQYLCLIVYPGTGSTFRLPAESVLHQSCIEASSFVNCAGMVYYNRLITSQYRVLSRRPLKE